MRTRVPPRKRRQFLHRSLSCASFQAALAMTLAGGEIFVLNSDCGRERSGTVKGVLSHVNASRNGVGILASGTGESLAVTDAVTSNKATELARRPRRKPSVT